MKTTTKQAELLTAMKGGKLQNQNQQNLLFKILNGTDGELKDSVKALFQTYDFEGFELSTEQSLKGFNWLKNLWVTPQGRERKNNPFGYREQAALENFERCTLKGYYDAGNYYYTHYIPLYDVYAKDGYGFEYYFNGTIHITG